MRSFLAAFRFLTIIPVPGTLGTAEQDLVESVPWIPIVGLIIGALAGAAAYGLAQVAPPMISAIVLIVFLLRISGGLHMDGLADTADGFFSARKSQRILDIMKDSRIGPMGAIALCSVFLMKFAGLSSVAPQHLWRIVALMPIAGRCLIVLQMAALPYARTEGLALLFYREPHRLHAVLATALLAAVSFLLLNWRGLILASACLLITAGFCLQCRRKINGATGDTFGYLCEMGETTVAILAPILLAIDTHH
jgi:adenosylcobinamide-GDP ribazoletransferase